MIIRALCVIKNEADVIRQTLLAAEAWCDEIHVLDNGSNDGSWEAVLSLATTHPRVIAHGRDTRPFTDDIRAQIFHACAANARVGDWWCRLDADEFYAEDPREVLGAVPADYFSVWSASLSYYFTDVDAARFATEPSAYADDVPVEEKCRHYLNHWSEPRFFRHLPGLRWREGDGGYPAGLWSRPASPRRILVRHFPYRSPAQIQRRLDARRGSAEFAHESIGDWAQAIADIRSVGRFVGVSGGRDTGSWTDRVVPAAALDFDSHDGSFVINAELMPPIPAPIPRIAQWASSARRLAHRMRATPARAG